MAGACLTSLDGRVNERRVPSAERNLCLKCVDSYLCVERNMAMDCKECTHICIVFVLIFTYCSPTAGKQGKMDVYLSQKRTSFQCPKGLAPAVILW
ncbi:hypothetical protein CDAR_554581 [Caerostris darwini]|uniref:Uncharacterized protein n=1 Tax=Caerostris darwini TaxID=1538125 RepID=A0AAV4UKY1_9ARAC|nr:hypothetical protein CDAR_554581 [Caerostris darwini]